MGQQNPERVQSWRYRPKASVHVHFKREYKGKWDLGAFEHDMAAGSRWARDSHTHTHTSVYRVQTACRGLLMETPN